MMGLMISPITGTQGNVEFFALITRASPAPAVDDATIDAVVEAASHREQRS